MTNRRLTATEVLRDFCNRRPALNEYGQFRAVDRTACGMLGTPRCAEAILGEPVGDRAGMASDLTPDLLERMTVGNPGR